VLPFKKDNMQHNSKIYFSQFPSKFSQTNRECKKNSNKVPQTKGDPIDQGQHQNEILIKETTKFSAPKLQHPSGPFIAPLFFKHSGSQQKLKVQKSKIVVTPTRMRSLSGKYRSKMFLMY